MRDPVKLYSMVICPFAQRAQLRGLIKYVDSSFVPAMYGLMAAQSTQAREERVQRVLDTWRWVDRCLERIAASVRERSEHISQAS